MGPPLFDSFKRYYNFSDKDANDAIYVFREYYDVKGWMDNAPFDGVEDMLKTLKEAGLELCNIEAGEPQRKSWNISN